MSIGSSPLAPTQELALLAGRRAFPVAQQLLSGSPKAAPQLMKVGWHGSSLDPETGAFARVQRDAGFDDLIGQIVRVYAGNRYVFAYVLGDAVLLSDLSLARRAFAGLARLSLDTLSAEVVSVQ